MSSLPSNPGTQVQNQAHPDNYLPLEINDPTSTAQVPSSTCTTSHNCAAGLAKVSAPAALDSYVETSAFLATGLLPALPPLFPHFSLPLPLPFPPFLPYWSLPSSYPSHLSCHHSCQIPSG
eukprot:4804701-Amphidinium_carterae.1